MTMNALALAPVNRHPAPPSTAVHARPASSGSAGCSEIVGGCPDHWWKPTALRTAACTCDR